VGDENNMEAEVSSKSRLVVTLLAWFLGVFGAHRFYLDKIGTALLMLFTVGGLGIWATIDFIMAVAGVMKDKDGKLIKNWEGATEKEDTSKILNFAQVRYAKGEITKEEFEQIKKDLSST
jgi:TM2 domain-containing membrane protein YozV